MEHDSVIETLKSAGQTVYLTVRYFKPAALFLKRGKYTNTFPGGGGGGGHNLL